MANRFWKVLPFLGAFLITTNASGCSNLPFVAMFTGVDGGVGIERLEDGSIMLHVDSCGNPIYGLDLTPYSSKAGSFEIERKDPISEPFSVKVGKTVSGWEVTTYSAPDGTETGWSTSAFGPEFGTYTTVVSVETFNKLQPGQYYTGWEDDGSGTGGNGHIVTKETFHNAVCEKEE